METLLILYKCFVRSIIDYASFAYFPTQKDLINKLGKIQFYAIRLCYGFRISTPTNILLAESKLVSIQERTGFLCNCYLYKVLSNSNFLIHTTIKRCEKKIERHKIAICNRIILSKIQNLEKVTNIQITNKHFNIYLHDYETLFLEDIDVDIEIGRTLKNCTNPNDIIKSLII